MLFEASFIEEIENEPLLGLQNACEFTLTKLEEFNYGDEWTNEEHELLLEAYFFISFVIKNFDISIDCKLPTIEANIVSNCLEIRDYITNVKELINEKTILLRIESYSNRYENVFKNTFAYEFSTGDIERVQELINELRTNISSLETLDQSHRQRLLKRLETLQSELHKRVSDLDKFWGLVGDAGVVLGKLGKDSKPIVDRIREIAGIAWNTQSRAEELPSNSSNPMIDNL